MRTTTRTYATVVAALGLAAAPIALAGSAFAVDPYVDGADSTVSTSTPEEGGEMTLGGSGFMGLEKIDLDIHSTVVRLGTVTADAGGSYTATVTMPAGLTCNHHITATGRTSGSATRNNVVIGDPASCDSNGNAIGAGDGSALPGTGAAVAGLVLVGAALIGGGVVLRRGARRKSDALV